MVRRKRKAPIELLAGETVLMSGGGRFSNPGDWWFATVLWSDAEHVVTRHAPTGGRPYVQALSIDCVRAVGPYVALREFQEHCRRETKKLAARVDAAEQALGRAREAVWAKLDALTCSTPLRLNNEETG